MSDIPIHRPAEFTEIVRTPDGVMLAMGESRCVLTWELIDVILEARHGKIAARVQTCAETGTLRIQIARSDK